MMTTCMDVVRCVLVDWGELAYGLLRVSTASLCLGPWLCVMMVRWLLLIQHLQYSHQCFP